ncbi:hypothetical protein SAY87_015262 [Trapa incisa]|uniref:Uncharacterized protein n=2 Tax=Trapa TaxID=22665 RepID=A0AAN7MGD0_TRANT|nr:hypothetical protein SAY87_015262 [Trapa incisa]KAK4803141.1 hypothetical protein SAY86_001344 [Trapa natans]
MASCQLQKPTEQTCNQKANEKSFGLKVSEMTHNVVVKTFGEQKQKDHEVITCQTQTYSEHEVKAKPDVHSHHSGHHGVATTGHGSHGMAGGHGKTKSENGLRGKLHEGKEKIKSLFKRKDKNGESSCSSSESESDDETCGCPKKD